MYVPIYLLYLPSVSSLPSYGSIQGGQKVQRLQWGFLALAVIKIILKNNKEY